MTKEDKINKLIAEGCETNLISDGFHTFGELYEHRVALYIVLCRKLFQIDGSNANIWRSKAHSDGTVLDGWFVLGIAKDKDRQITYHLPERVWEETNFAETLERAPEYDGHASEDVLERLKEV